MSGHDLKKKINENYKIEITLKSFKTCAKTQKNSPFILDNILFAFEAISNV